MISSRERSKLWVQQENPGTPDVLVNQLWNDWRFDQIPSGLDYFLLHCAVAFGRLLTLDWIKLCDPGTRRLQNIPFEEAVILIDKIELVWRRRLRSLPGWETHRAAWVNKVNRVKKRAMELVEEKRNEEAASSRCVSAA